MSDQEIISQCAFDIRGRILQLAIEFEKIMEIYIAEHFTNDLSKIQELIVLILAPRMTLSQKREVFYYLVETHNKEFFDKNSVVMGKLNDLVVERNIFAHWPVDFGPEAINIYNKYAAVTFVKFKNMKDSVTKESLIGEIRRFTQKDINDKIKLFHDCNAVLRKLIGMNGPSS
jgi:hypothetical protein